MKDEALKLQIEAQITGFRNHLRHLTERHRKVETNTRRALGHAYEAIRLSIKLRRLYLANDKAQQRDEGAYAEGDCSHLSWCYTEGMPYSLEGLGDDAWLTGCPLCGSSDCGRNLTPEQIAERDAFYSANASVSIPGGERG
jgi:hypothetical protein